ncbi:hypothetical protein DITRI_Ditri14bG0145300 [Diplodiscus trichospermus]
MPSEFGTFTSLAYLNLSNTGFSGKVPSHLSHLSKLVSLDLSGNIFQLLEIEEHTLEGLVQNLTEVRQLSFHGIDMSSSNPNLLMNLSSSLRSLDLSYCDLRGKFPKNIFDLSNLKLLVLSYNSMLSLHLPKFNQSSQLEYLDLSKTSFSTESTKFIDLIENLSSLKDLSLSKTSLSGGLPGSIGNLVSLKKLDLSGCNLSGSIPSYSIQIAMKGQEIELVKIFTMLTSIDLSSNKFEGEIPMIIGKLNSLKGLNLSHNNIIGCIPASIGNLTSLEWLDLSSNKLIGTIPESLLDLTFLSFFSISGNQLGGQIPKGKQFNTFGNESYKGNKGLCGFPVSKGSSSNESPSPELPPSILPEKANFDFGWKVVLIGYGCGVMFGLFVGYVVFRTGKPIWLVSLVEDQYLKRRRKSKVGNRSGARRP